MHERVTTDSDLGVGAAGRDVVHKTHHLVDRRQAGAEGEEVVAKRGGVLNTLEGEVVPVAEDAAETALEIGTEGALDCVD